MKDVVSQQLNKLLKLTGDSHSDMAAKLGMGRPAVSNWTSGRVEIPLKHVYSLLQVYPGLRVEWLLLDRGQPFAGGGHAEYVDDDGGLRGDCRGCIRLEAQVELLREDASRKSLRIEELLRELGGMGKKNNDVKGYSRAAG